MRESSSKQILLSVLGVAILVVAVVGVSFAAFSFTGTGSKPNTITSGTITMTYSENGTGISITDAMPMTDAAGKVLDKANEQFKFDVGATVSGTTTINYEIAAIKKAGIPNPIPDADVRLYLESKDSEAADTAYAEAFAPAPFTGIATATTLGSPAGSMILESGQFTATKTNNYILRMWLANDAQVTNEVRTFTVTVNVYGAQATAQ